jgi:hypothetical protein
MMMALLNRYRYCDGTGTDVAIESAKITLVKGDLQGIVKAKELSDHAMKNINQNNVHRNQQGFYPFFLAFADDCCIGNELLVRFPLLQMHLKL